MKIRIRSAALRFAVCAAIGTLSGCGGGGKNVDDDDATPQAGNGGKGSSSGNGAAGSSGPVECGKKTCTADGDDKPCCLDTKTDFCGVLNTSSLCKAVADPRCPSVPNATLGDFTSCCTPDGDCGVDLSWNGQGCQSLDDQVFRIANPNAPEPRRCDAADAGEN